MHETNKHAILQKLSTYAKMKVVTIHLLRGSLDMYILTHSGDPFNVPTAGNVSQVSGTRESKAKLLK